MSGAPTPPPSSPHATGALSGVDRRRTIRIQRSALLEAKLDQLDRPSIKIAETLDEYAQAFKVLHDVYLASGYLKDSSPSGLHFGAHHLLPKTCVFVFKAYLTVLSTMSYIPDTPDFGLPMDELYKDEVDRLRQLGRKVVEIGALATIPHRRWHNLIVFLAKAIFQYAMVTGADDLCIMVNPKHVRFYQSIFLFEPLGDLKHYGKVDAPAVALRADMRNIEPALYQAYHSGDFESDLHAFFVKINSNGPDLETASAEKNTPLESEIARVLFQARPSLLPALRQEQQAYLERMYHKALFATPVLSSTQ